MTQFELLLLELSEVLVWNVYSKWGVYVDMFAIVCAITK